MTKIRRVQVTGIYDRVQFHVDKGEHWVLVEVCGLLSAILILQFFLPLGQGCNLLLKDTSEWIFAAVLG